MLRIEIVSNHSVEENLLEALAEEGAAKYYTRFPSVYGVGSSGPRMGDAIWPEETFALVVWCEKDEAERIERAVAKVKAEFPDEGVKLFGMPDPAETARLEALLRGVQNVRLAAVSPASLSPATGTVAAGSEEPAPAEPFVETAPEQGD
jgi:hypothetical protein